MMMMVLVNARPHQPTSDVPTLLSSAEQQSLQSRPGSAVGRQATAERANQRDEAVLSTAVHDSVAERSMQVTQCHHHV